LGRHGSSRNVVAALQPEINAVKRIMFLAGLLLTATSGVAAAQDTPQAVIQRELDQMLAAWNHDDLDAHIAAYHDSATWTTSSGLLHGKQAIRQTLIRAFQRGSDLAGELSFGKSEFRILSDDVIMTNGSFTVSKLPSGKDIHGQSTLIWKRNGSRWQIVHDHSS
jgi:uncharacterized protein (TIGR02246 family)